MKLRKSFLCAKKTKITTWTMSLQHKHMQGQKALGFHQKYIFIRGLFIFGWTIPLKWINYKSTPSSIGVPAASHCLTALRASSVMTLGYLRDTEKERWIQPTEQSQMKPFVWFVSDLYWSSLSNRLFPLLDMMSSGPLYQNIIHAMSRATTNHFCLRKHQCVHLCPG